MIATSILFDAWATALWQACWQGGLLVLAVWLICRFIPSMPAKYQCWFWRLAVLKFMMVLLCPTLLNLPLLPAPSVAVPVAEASLQIVTESPGIPMDQVEVSPKKAIELPSVQAILCFAWIIGVGWSLARLLIAWHRARQLRKQGHIIDCVPLIEQLAIQARLFGLRGSPELLEIPGCGSPMLIGMFRPAIAIPTETYRRLTAAERTIVLGHELAHIRRGDLLWRFVAACVRATFFFHPLVWLSHWRLSLAQEIAADQLAIAQQKHDPVSYGKLLVAVVEKFGSRRLIPSLSLGTMEPVESLTRRLIAMMSVGRVSRRIVVSSAVLLATTVLLGLVPWRLVAAEEAEKALSSVAEKSVGPLPKVQLGTRPDDSAKLLIATVKVSERPKDGPEEVYGTTFGINPTLTLPAGQSLFICSRNKGRERSLMILIRSSSDVNRKGHVVEAELVRDKAEVADSHTVLVRDKATDFYPSILSCVMPDNQPIPRKNLDVLAASTLTLAKGQTNGILTLKADGSQFKIEATVVPEKAHVYTVSYDVAYLLKTGKNGPPDFDSLIGKIKAEVTPSVWDDHDGGWATITPYLPNRLVVTHSQRGHQLLTDMLVHLRSEKLGQALNKQHEPRTDGK